MENLFNNPLVIVFACIIITLVVVNIIIMIYNGKIVSITKNGVKFKDSQGNGDIAKDIDLIRKSHEATRLALQEMSDRVSGLERSIHSIDLACIRIQIISTETSFETKCKLYDDYKKKGGNSYIDTYMKDVEEHYECENYSSS